MPSEIKIDDFKISPKDTGSSSFQIAQITKRVLSLTQHFKTHKKDFHSQTGLVKLINRRKSLLSYLKKNNRSQYQSVIDQLGLRK